MALSKRKLNEEEFDDEDQISEGSELDDKPRVAQWVDEEDIDDEDQSEEETASEMDSNPDVEEYKNLEKDLSNLPLGAIIKARKTVNNAEKASSSSSSSSDSDSEVEDKGVGAIKSKDVPHRPHKHAPVEMSSKRAVTRRRQVVEVHQVKPRDPRFSELSGTLDETRYRSQYGFLNDMHKNELSTLKEPLARARKLLLNSPRNLREEREKEVNRLEQAVKRAESIVNREKRQQAELKGLETVRKEERDKRKAGKKGWWLKKSDEKDIRLRARLDDLEESGGKRAVKKAIEKKQRKIGQKEKKSRPFAPTPRSQTNGDNVASGSKRHREGENVNHSNKRPQSSLRSLTWFLPGRFKDAELASEALSAVLNLLSLYHDTIIGRRLAQTPKWKPLIPPSSNSRYTRAWADKDRLYKWIARALEVIKFTELLLEMNLRRKLGEKGRWRSIIALETVKAVLRIILLRITRRPLISPPLPERDFDPANLPALDPEILQTPSTNKQASSSSLSSTPDHLKNNHISLDIPNPLLTEKRGNGAASPVESYLLPKALSPSSLTEPTCLINPLSSPRDWLSELTYVLRPLIYVIALSKDSTTSRPVVLSLALDLSSRYLRRSPPPSSALERAEYAHRDRDLLWYLFRSQIWTLYTRPKLVGLADKTATAPVLGLFSAFVRDWMPLIDDYYYYSDDSHLKITFAHNMPIWLVTGTSRGLGLEFVRQIAQKGDEVIAAARNPENAEALQTLSKSFPHISVIKMDIDDPESIKTAAQEVEKILQGRGLDYLINNAGRGPGGNDNFSEIDPEKFFSLMRSNCLGPILVWQALIPALERSTRPEGPVVLNITSGVSSIGVDYGVINPCYSTSKTALNMMTYKQSKEKPNMIIFVMDPGWVKTEMGGEGAILEITFSVSGQYEVAVKATSKDSGTFKRYDGTTPPW